MRRLRYPPYWLLLCAALLSPTPAATAASPTKVRFQKAVDVVVKKYSEKETDWGIAIRRLDNGYSLYEKQSLRMLAPASNRKLFTSALALEKMGPRYRFQTALYLDGKVEERGHMRSNVRIVGDGDPTFCNPRFHAGSQTNILRDWAKTVKAAGVSYIHGDVVVDCSSFRPGHDAVRGLPEDWSLSYMARPSCVAINENCVSVRIQPSSTIGQPATIRLYPSNCGVKLTNQTKTGSRRSANTLNIARQPDADVIVATGNAPQRSLAEGRKVALRHPEQMVGNIFKDLLRQEGVFVKGEVKVVYTRPEERGARLASYESPPLAEILQTVNRDSNNFCAEQVYQSVSRRLNGVGSYEGTRKLELEFLDVIGVPIKYITPVDGSGLSRDNRCTADSVVRLLSWASQQRFFKEFKNSLAVSGKYGTLRHRMGDTRLKGHVFAKTGTLNGISALSGYYVTPKGTHYVFSILVNKNKSTKSVTVQDQIIDQLARHYGGT